MSAFHNKPPLWRSAWITGASHGIGRALALELAAYGTQVAASARDDKRLLELQRSRSGITPYTLDVTDSAATAATVDTIEEAVGPLDLAILSAGIYQPLPGGVGDPDLFRRHVEVNYLGVVNALMAVLPKMQQRETGQVAIMGSVAGYRGLPKAAPYGPTKAALINLAETLRLDLADSGVDIRLISPGFVATRLTAKNDFNMPAILTPDAAAGRILRGLASNSFEIVFPRRFTVWLKLGRVLPYWLWFPAARRLLG